MHTPKCIILISGKRKCGKDYYAELLHQRLGSISTILRISQPVKGQYAEQHKLDLNELMSDGPYKEIHRKAMIEWSDIKRMEEPGYFCGITCRNAPESDIWIVSDIRRKTDILWFHEQYTNIKTIRIIADDAARLDRGWKFTKGVDDVTSECDLDEYQNWDLIIQNNDGAKIACEDNINRILLIIDECKGR